MGFAENEGLELMPMMENDISPRLGCSCPKGTHTSGEYTSKCCLHDCDLGNGKGSKWVTGWN